MTLPKSIIVSLSITATLALGAGCRDPRTEKPYTPFGVVSADAPEPEPEPPPSAEPTFAREKSILAPRAARSWTLDGRELRAPEKHLFERGLVADFDGDGISEIVAWVVPEPGQQQGPTQGLWLYRSDDDAGQLLVGGAPFLPTGPECDASTELERTGPSTVTLDTRVGCKTPLLPRAPVRALRVIRPLAKAPELMTLRIGSIGVGGDEEPAIELDTADRDDDGRDDVALSVTLGTPSDKARAELRFAWFDRKSGLARDATLPAKDLIPIASLERTRSSGKNTSLLTLTRVARLRQLFAHGCAESGTPGLFEADGSPIPCGISHAIWGDLALAEAQAHLAQKAIGRAISVLERRDWYAGALPSAQEEALRGMLEKAAKRVRQKPRWKSRSRPREGSRFPRYSPLHFEPDGQLLVQRTDGVTRLDPETGEEVDVTEEVDDWPLTVISPRGERLFGVGYPCDTNRVTLVAISETGAPTAPRPTPLLAPRPGTCQSGRGGAAELALHPVAWNERGLHAFLGSYQLEGDPPEAGTPLPKGSARSANGRYAVVPTPLGLLVLDGERSELWQGTAQSPAATDCVIAPRGEQVACVHSGRALVIAPEAAEPAPE